MKKPPTEYIIAGYLTFTIPSAMLARIVRKVTGIKHTLFEKKLMKYYYSMSKKLLKGINNEKK